MDDIVAELQDKARQAYGLIPSRAELMERYGDRNGTTIYNIPRCIEMKWLDKYRLDHPEVQIDQSATAYWFGRVSMNAQQSIAPAGDRSAARALGANALIVLLFIALLALMAFSLTLGRYPVSVRDVIHTVLSTRLGETRQYADPVWVVVEIVRMPRVLLVVLCGMGLSLAGAALQGVFRNPLVSPEVLGVTTGASFGGVLAIMLSLSAPLMTGLAFIFGIGAISLSFGVARLAGPAKLVALLLAGFIVSAFFGALVGLRAGAGRPADEVAEHRLLAARQPRDRHLRQGCTRGGGHVGSRDRPARAALAHQSSVARRD